MEKHRKDLANVESIDENDINGVGDEDVEPETKNEPTTIQEGGVDYSIYAVMTNIE